MQEVKRKITYTEFREMELDHPGIFQYELINAEIVKKQSPNFRHQNIGSNLEEMFRAFVKPRHLGVVFRAPLDVVLDDENAYQPDVGFIRQERVPLILPREDDIIYGAPDLVVEILSKSTGRFDKGDKKDTYERCGVREYWLIDPKSKAVEVYCFENERYKLKFFAQENGIVQSQVLEGFELDIEKIFE